MRNVKKKYLLKLHEEPDPDKRLRLPHGSRGRPLMLRCYDVEVAQYIKSLRIAGGIVNRSILIGAAKGIVFHRNPALLKEHGGTIDLGCKWAEFFLSRHGDVKRKAKKSARKLPANLQKSSSDS